MADGALKIELTGPLADDVRAAAEARGLTPEDYVRESLAEGLATEATDLDWNEDLRRLEEPGENVPLDQAFDRFRDNIAAARASKE